MIKSVGILGLTDKIDEEESIDILTGIISKADEFESAIGEDGGEGRRRLQSFGTNNNLFQAYIRVSVLKLQGLDEAAILDQLTMVFTERVVRIIAANTPPRAPAPPQVPLPPPLLVSVASSHVAQQVAVPVTRGGYRVYLLGLQ